MKIRSAIFPLHLITRLFPRTGGVNTKLLMGIIAFSASQIAALVLATYYEGTFFLPGVGKGLMEHYGVWAIVVTDPLLLISTSYAYCLFRKCLRTIPTNDAEYKRQARRTVYRERLSFLLMKDASGSAVYLFLVILGCLSFANNIVQTCSPAEYYGNDVFDASQYTLGFLTNKFNLFLSWVVVYPIAAFFCLTMSVSLYAILKQFRDSGQLVAEMHHPDKCFGHARLGTLNLVLMTPYFLTYNVMFFLAETHESTYMSLIIPLIGMTVIFILASYMTLYPLAAFIRSESAKQVDNIQTQLQYAMHSGVKPTIRVAIDSLYISMMHSTPYSKNSQRLLTALRAATITMTAYKTFFTHA